MPLLKLHEENIRQAKAVCRTYGVVYIHGCGNFYTEQTDSDFRRDFTNVNPDMTPHASTYVKKYTNAAKIPKTIELLEKELLEAKHAKMVEDQKPQSLSKVKTFTVTDEDDEDGNGDDEETGAGSEDEEAKDDKPAVLVNKGGRPKKEVKTGAGGVEI